MLDFAQNDPRKLSPRRRAHRGVSSLTTSNQQLTTPRAFTLIELLIVLAIIGLVAALGVPLFGVLTGSRSVEAGRNVVAATLGQARTVAVNEGKFAGVMFYVDPATERTAMSIVVVTDPASSLEDADPYDKYKAWVPDEFYYSGKTDAGQTRPRRGDRVIGLAADANTVFRGLLYPANPLASNYLNYFGNYRPTVRTYRCYQTHADTVAKDTVGQRPPRNGPYNNPAANDAKYYARPGGPTAGTNYGPTLESSNGPFANELWGFDDQTAIARYSTGEQTLLPRGVGVQLMVQPIPKPAAFTSGGIVNPERYVRTGVIMFDPQGRLVLRDFSLERTDPLGEYIQLADRFGAVLTPRARRIASGVGLTIYDSANFKGQADFSEADTVYQVTAGNDYLINAPTNPAFLDFKSFAAETGVPNPPANTPPSEEQWLDANGTPLVINRYTGSMSEAD